ncbi:MAG: hypothetical protein U0941_04805 [Planctomycetaceae bacterium]
MFNLRRLSGSLLCQLGLVLAAVMCGFDVPAFAAEDDDGFQLLDANDDGVLSGSEAFSVLKYDTDKDGEVTKAEYRAGVKALQKQLLSFDDGEFFRAFDGNEDDVLSGKEATTFKKYDTDGDGEISRKEFEQGRAADRRALGVPDRAELARQARQKFQQLDANEDGRLSGKEMTGIEKLDTNGDKRITEAEFLAGFDGAGAATDPVGVFLAMIRTTNPEPFLAACLPEFASEMDGPVLEFIMKRLAIKLGELDPAAKEALKSREVDIEGMPHTAYEGDLKFKEGKATASLIVSQGKIAGFRVDSPALDDIGDQMYLALTMDQKFSRAMADYYTPRCEDFVRLILTKQDDKAFAKYHPEVQKQIGRERAQVVFETLRANCGSFKAIELETLRVEFDSNMKGENCQITHLVRGSKAAYLVTTTFQFVGLSAQIVGLSIKPPEPEQVPAGEPGKGADKWVKVAANAEGVTFEMPFKAKRTVNEEKQTVTYRAEAPDNSVITIAIIESLKEDFEPKAEVYFAALQKDLVEALEGELIDTDDAKAGKHPGRLMFIKAKDGVFFVERAVVVGRRIYRFQYITQEVNKRQRELIGNRLFESAKFLETDDDLQELPKPPTPPKLPAPPKPVTKPPVP